jgi:hypothetical protein
MPRPEEGGFVLAALGAGGGGGDRVKVVFPPEGSIPAATMNGANTELTPGTANCFEAKWEDGKWEKQTDTISVQNTVTRAICTDGVLQIKKTDAGPWVIDVEDCG